MATFSSPSRCEVVLDALRCDLNPAVGRRIISSVLPNLLREFRGFGSWLSVLQRAFMLTSLLIGSRPAAGRLGRAERQMVTMNRTITRLLKPTSFFSPRTYQAN